MTLQQGLVLLALAALVAGLVHGRFAPGTLFGGVALLLVLCDLQPIDRALAHFTNPGLVAVLLLMLLAAVLDRVQAIEGVTSRLLRGPYRVVLLRLLVFTASCSAFLNNTAVVASLLGPLKQAREHPAHRLLMPMCFAASLGGILTLVGTSTNLLVDSLLVARGMPGLGIFTPTAVGLCIVLVCGALMVLTMPRLLGHHMAADERSDDFFVEATLQADSPLVGSSVTEAGLRHLVHLFLIEIVRGGRTIAPVDPDARLQAGDVLIFSGDVTRLDLLLRFPGLQPGTGQALPRTDELTEVVITPGSSLAHRTLRECDFRGRFDAAVVAMRRRGERLGGGLGDQPLAAGDGLTLVTGPDFDKRAQSSDDFLLVGRRTLQRFSEPWRDVVALTTFGAAVLAAAAGWIGLVEGLLVLLVLFMACGFVRAEELRLRVPYSIVLVIASALTISDVMQRSGTATLMASAALDLANGIGPYGALAAVLIVTWLLTELMSNNAAAALCFPVACDVAERMAVSPMPFVMAVLYAASCSFLTPYGYQTNLMIMAPGRYTLADYLRCGLPVALGFIGTALLAIPWIFPFR